MPYKDKEKWRVNWNRYYANNKEKIMEYHKERFKNPKKRQQNAEYFRKYYSNPMNKKKHSDLAKRKRKKSRDGELMRYYGISQIEYDLLFYSQHGVCAICHQPEIKRNLSVDHNHENKKVRGLLCTRCNWAVGYAESGIGKLLAIVDYLDKHR